MQKNCIGCLLALLLTGPAAAEDSVSVTAAWIREAPPGIDMLAGYFSLSNHGDAAIALAGARSERFAAIEMHHTRIDDGLARMRRLERVELSPGERVDFAPGGRHLMLFDPRAPLAAGDCVMVTLLLEGGQEIDVRFEVRRG